MSTLLIPLLKKQVLTRSWDILRLLLYGFYPAYIIMRTMQRRGQINCGLHGLVLCIIPLHTN